MGREMSLSKQQFEPIHAKAKDEVKSENDAAHDILKEMFPRQYGLPSVFNSQWSGRENKVGHCSG
jgi:hypothetical protein